MTIEQESLTRILSPSYSSCFHPGRKWTNKHGNRSSSYFHSMECKSKQTGTTLLVQNLEPYVSDDDVRRVFEKFGSLESVKIITKNPNTTKPHVPYKFAAMVKFSSSTEAKNALQGADGVNDWVVRYDPDSRPFPFKLTNKDKNRLPPWLYTPRQLADFVEKNQPVPPLIRPPIQAPGLPENLNGLVAKGMAPARLQLNLGPGVTPPPSSGDLPSSTVLTM